MQKLKVFLQIDTDYNGVPYCTWVGTDCPFCGQRHTHGAGRDMRKRSLRKMLGGRVAHCFKGDYVLEWDGFSKVDLERQRAKNAKIARKRARKRAKERKRFASKNDRSHKLR